MTTIQTNRSSHPQDTYSPHQISELEYWEKYYNTPDIIYEWDTVRKKDEYAKAGVKEFYILDANRERTQFFRLNKAQCVYKAIKPQKGGIIKSKVLPGFQFRIDDLFTKPSPDEMINDKVYQDFVLPGYLMEKRARLLAEKRARLAIQEAEQRIEQLAEQLRASGVEPVLKHKNGN
ncbi:MAG: hypothetical protein ABFS56_26420 [Pseudomonadota bacterium]